MAEQGADAVICQHSHCVGSYEVYRNRLIVYGQGNFVFDRKVRDEQGWRAGMLVRLELAENPVSFSFIPYTQFGDIPQVCAVEGDALAYFFKELDARSRKLSDPDFVEQEWIRFCKKNGPAYLSAALGQGTFMRRVNRLFPVNRFLYPRQNLRVLLNGIRCESLRDTVLTYLENRKDLS